MTDMFKSLTLKRWRQFETVEIDLTSKLTILTGPNGCGKTTILNVLGRHFGWHINFLTSSYLTENADRLYGDAWDLMEDDSPRPLARRRQWKSRVQAGSWHNIGQLTYESLHTTPIDTYISNNNQSNINFTSMANVHGIFIPSHRPPPGHSQIASIAINPRSAQEFYQTYQTFLFQSYGEHPQRNPSAAMKEAIIGFAVFGEGNRSVRPNESYTKILNGFESILRHLMPTTIGFKSLEVETPDVYIVTDTGRFPLESMSGGLSAIVGIAWQIHMNGMDDQACTVLLDEPENHLHPTMQRELLPRLIQAFPSHRFIIATHSPFIVTSTQQASVYAFSYDINGRIGSYLLSEADLAASPSKVLREVLDVPVTMPIWVEDRIKKILAKFQGDTFDDTVISNLRAELRAEGLEEAFGDFLAQPQGDME